MELNRVADIDNSKINHIEKSKSVKEISNDQKIIDDEKYKKNQSKNGSQFNEVLLDNVKFGYNLDSKDFYIKIIRGEAEYKYPTEDMMKIKAYLLNELKNQHKIIE